MITIKEDISQKCPGETSLFLTFPYSQEVVNFIKGLECFNFNKNTKIWEVPITNLSELVDNLVFLDDIEILPYLPPKTSEIALKQTLNYKLKTLPHQDEGIIYGLNHDSFILGDGMGLGKTKQLIHIAEERKAQEGIEHCLVVCGINTLKSNWKKEIEKHSNLSCMILGEKISSKGNISYSSVKERAEQLKNPIDEFFIITNIETLRSDEVIKALKNGANKIDMMAVDEIHKCKSPTSEQGKNLLKLTDIKYKIAMTGTLLLNSPLDAFVPLKWIGVEHCTYTMFKKYYCVFSNFGKFQNLIGFKNTDMLKHTLSNNMLRRTKDIIELPPKTIIEEFVDLSTEHRKFYDDISKGIKDEVDKVQFKNNSLLSMVTRLRQATALPSILTSSNIKSSKVERAVDLVEQIVSGGDKVVIMSNFKDTVTELAKELKEYNPLILTGDSKEDEAVRNQELFQTDDKYKVFIATWQKAGTGLTLTAANYMIHMDTAWTYALFEQTNDRIYRIGTNKAVFIYNLIAKDTIDERVLEILNTKQAISDFIVDDKVTEKSLEKLKNYIENL